MIINSTQVPNYILDEVMPDLSDTAFRVLMIIVRQTFGWIEDIETGRRKEKDWLAYSQLILKSGRSKRSMIRAIKELREKNLIEVYSEDGVLIVDKSLPGRKKLFYRVATRKGAKFTPLKVPNWHPTKETNTKDNIRASSENNYPRVENIVDKRDLLKGMGFDVKKGGATQEWQDHAARLAKALGFKGGPQWFKHFRDAYSKGLKGLLDSTYSSMADVNAMDPEKYFYKMFWNKVNKVGFRGEQKADT